MRVTEKTLAIMRRFVESRGVEFPRAYTDWQGTTCHPWTLIRTVDRKTGNCYAAWCLKRGKTFNCSSNLRAFVYSERHEFEIGDWVLWMPWFPQSHRYGQVIDLQPCNGSVELYPVVKWEDGTISFASSDFCEVCFNPRIKPEHQLSYLQLKQGVSA